jgi:phosphoglycolate phosphatase-like HAD superfamily hydrolase
MAETAPVRPLPRAATASCDVRLVIFDFDGTLSWIRHGWPGIMRALFRDHLPPLAGETPAAATAVIDGIIFGLNGKPTLLQMIRFAEVVRERGGPAHDPEALRRTYQERLDAAIAARAARVRARTVADDAYVVHGARALLDHLHAAGIRLAVVSSTVEERVREEAELLDLTRYFAGRIHGCVGDPTTYTKRAVFERLVREAGVAGHQVLAFGDGPVEIVETKRLGGVAVAVCSDEEHNGSGNDDPVKHRQLLDAGADHAIPDYRDAIALVERLRGRA